MPEPELVAASVFEQVVRPGPTSGQAPGTSPPTAHAAVAGDRRGVLEDPVLPHAAEPATVGARASTCLRVQRVALDEKRESRLDDLDRVVVGVSVGGRDQRILAVAVMVGAPTADIRLGVDEQRSVPGVSADDVRHRQAGVAARTEPLRHDRGERLPDQLGREGGGLVVPAGR